MIYLFVYLACYFVGAIPFGLIVGKTVKGIDIRDFGSGNIGASNVLRTLGTGWGVTVFVLDLLKGLGPTLLCKAVGMNPWLVLAGAMLAVVGHTLSVFLRFRGGKGVATSLGVIFGLNWLVAVIAFGMWVIIVGVTRYISLASIIATLSVPVMMVFWKSLQIPVAYQVLAIIAAFAIVIKHRSNMQRLFKGTEAKIGQKVDVTRSSSSEA